MIAGNVTSECEAVIALDVRAVGGRPESIEAILDTGFTEFLALPRAAIARLGLRYRGSQRATLADGSDTDLATYRAIVEWHGHARAVSVLEIGGGALVGMALLQGSRLTMDVVADGAVKIVPIP
jgi:clan AA aspartic protease